MAKSSGGPRSENGRLAVAAGYTPGTKEYKSYIRQIQRYTTTAQQRRTPGKNAPLLSKLAPSEAQKVKDRQRAREVILQARRQQGRSAASPYPLKIVIRAKIQVGNTPGEVRRGKQSREVRITITNDEQMRLLREADWYKLLAWEFFGDPDSSYPIYATDFAVYPG